MEENENVLLLLTIIAAIAVSYAIITDVLEDYRDDHEYLRGYKEKLKRLKHRR